MTVKQLSCLLLASLLITACSTGIGSEAPEPNEGPAEGAAFVFNLEEVEEEPEALEFEEEEGLEFFVDSIPPGGDWLLSEKPGVITCPTGPDTTIPGEPPELVSIEVSEDGKTIHFPTAQGLVILTQYDLSAEGDLRFSSYRGSIRIEGETLTIDLDYNLADYGEIFGTIELTIDTCKLTRNFEAEYVGLGD
ncbi:MAG: hypothetical protein ABFS17_13090 [Chloroflexota bacterium]